MTDIANNNLWEAIRKEAIAHADQEPILASFLYATILNHKTLESALSFHLASKIDSTTAPALLVREVINDCFNNETVQHAIREDIIAIYRRDSACHYYSTPLLYYKGFHALQCHRVSHWLWNQNRTALALFFQNRISECFGVDIHPAAQMGHGIMLDHATGLVIGETAVVKNNVSIMQSVTLGGTGKEEGDRHPKIDEGVLISAGAKILGNIKIGEGSKVAAGSVVLHDVEPHTVVCGIPAKPVGKVTGLPSLEMDHKLC